MKKKKSFHVRERGKNGAVKKRRHNYTTDNEDNRYSSFTTLFCVCAPENHLRQAGRFPSFQFPPRVFKRSSGLFSSSWKGGKKRLTQRLAELKKTKDLLLSLSFFPSMGK